MSRGSGPSTSLRFAQDDEFIRGRYSFSFPLFRSWHLGAFAECDQATLRVGNELLAGVGDVEVAHRELADTVSR